MTDPSTVLCFAGLLLFLLGLLNGIAIPFGRSPRIGLSAHLTGVQSGTFLIAAGLLWPRLGLSPLWNAAVAHTLCASLYALWLSLFLAGIFGAGRGLPIAGQGITTAPAKQALVTVLLAGGSLGTIAAVAAALIGWL